MRRKWKGDRKGKEKIGRKGKILGRRVMETKEGNMRRRRREGEWTLNMKQTKGRAIYSSL